MAPPFAEPLLVVPPAVGPPAAGLDMGIATHFRRFREIATLIIAAASSRRLKEEKDKQAGAQREKEREEQRMAQEAKDRRYWRWHSVRAVIDSSPPPKKNLVGDAEPPSVQIRRMEALPPLNGAPIKGAALPLARLEEEELVVVTSPVTKVAVGLWG